MNAPPLFRALLLPTGAILFLGSVLGIGGACGSGGATAANGGIGYGGACDARTPCRAGLTCDATGHCTTAGTTENGKPCVIGRECASGMCGAGRVCESAGSGLEGTSCAGDRDCAKGLRCAFDGSTLFPKCLPEGTTDVGGECATSRDCFQGLSCEGGRCTEVRLPPERAPKGIPPYVPSGKPWEGPTCPAPITDASKTVTALWRLPRAADPIDGDFFNLPFPNDARRGSDGTVSFANFPHDEKSPVGFDVVKRYLDAVASQPFGGYSTVYFRFSGQFSFDSVGIGASGDPQTRLVDLTTGAGFGQFRGLSVYFTSGRTTRYACENFLAVRPAAGDPLRPGGTYAVVLKKGLKRPAAQGAGLIVADTDFQAMMADVVPSDALLANAWSTYAPLRKYLLDTKIPASDVIAASVFTIGDPKITASKLRASVRAAYASPPKVDAWVKCDTGAKSPCPDADGARACGAADPDFDELHSMVEIPIFQKGTAPYLAPKDGGNIDLPSDASAAIAPVRTEKVCVALSVPKGTAPSGGWPVAIYAHGTGGSFRSHATDGAAKMLSKIPIGGGGGASVGFAVLGIDQVSHGPRRNGSKLSPNDLFFNFANPLAARFNAVQGAADQHALVRVIEDLKVDVGGTAVKLDPTRVVYWGHSQGATEGAICLAYDTTVQGALLSGEGAGLIEALTTKTSPIDIKGSMWVALEELGPDAVNGFHPVLSILQNDADPSDPLHYAALDVVAAGSTPFPRSVFQPYGTLDTYTPPEVELNYVIAAQLGFVGPSIDLKFPPLDSIQGNVSAGKATAAFRQYAPSGYDGHFVVYKNDQAKGDATKFLARVARGEVPKIPE